MNIIRQKFEGITIKFDVYVRNKKVGRVEIENGVLVKNETYTDVPLEYIYGRVKDSETMIQCLIDTCFCLRHEKNMMMAYFYGLDDYDPIKLLKRSHAYSYSMRSWFKFDDDYDGVCWETVNPESDQFREW